MKTAISIPDQIFSAAENLAQRLGVSRSELYSKAMAEYLESHISVGVTEKLNQVYSCESSEISEDYVALQMHSIDEERW
ncbi:MAG: hypothetical protein IPM37_08015 [Hahellaceae bacterium]|nr:hypothetical protein [Hahellaceae bacterium]